jgi:hypothetical protein
MNSRKLLLDRCEAWCRATGCSEATLGTYSCGDPRAIGRFRRRLSKVTLDQFDCIMSWLDQNPAETWRERHPIGRPRRRPSDGEILNDGKGP